MSIQEAISLLKANGYRVSKPKPKKVKDRVGPTFVAKFADGEITRMSTYTSIADLDWGRGQRLSRAAYQSRMEQRKRDCSVPPIVSCHFEQDGVMLGKPLRAAA
jgi:hypothetical protein